MPLNQRLSGLGVRQKSVLIRQFFHVERSPVNIRDEAQTKAHRKNLKSMPRDDMHERGLCRHAVSLSLSLSLSLCVSMCLSRS